MRFLKVARMGAKLLGIKVDYLRFGEVDTLALGGDKLLYLLGEIIRCSLINLC